MEWTPGLTGRAVTMASRGIVAAPHYLAAESGIWAVQQGGSAVDAAVAANAVLAVVYPHLAGLGGDAFAMIWHPGRARPICLNGSGRSGYRATIQFYRDRGHDLVPARGPLAANTVPGAVAAWADMHARWGKLPWAQLFEPAIHYAEAGFAVSANLSLALERERQVLERYDRTRQVFLSNGRPCGVGERLVQPALAQTLRSVATRGAAAFYRGEVAAEIVSYLEKHGGLITHEDLRDHHSDWVEPLASPYRGCTVYEFPPNTQGLAALLILNLAAGWDVRALGDRAAAYFHLMVEAAKVALADLDEWLTDPAFVALPLERFLSPEYAAERRALILAERARPLKDYAAGVAVPAEAPVFPSGTAYIAAADAGGLAVSLIQSPHSNFGSCVVAGDTGVILQNSGASFKLDPDDPNALQPHKRPFESLIPAMVFEGERPLLVFGCSGSQGQPQTHAALVTRVLDLGYNVQQAIEAPRWLYSHPRGTELDALYLEGRVPDSVLRQLREMGHDVKVAGDWSDMMGQAQAVLIDWERGLLHGGADPRGDGMAVGW